MQNIDSDLIRGNIDTIILKTMLNEDKYGLDIIKEVEQRSNGTYELKQPTLYSCLKRLENQELISSYWLNSDIGGRRHYYKLTDKGREFYNKKQEEWAKSKFVIDNLLSNYNYEEYRLVKKDEYDKAMNATAFNDEKSPNEELNDTETQNETAESFENNDSQQTTDDTVVEAYENEESDDSLDDVFSESSEDNNQEFDVDEDDEENESHFEESFDSTSELSDDESEDYESEEDDDNHVYVSNVSSVLEEEYEDDEELNNEDSDSDYDDTSPSYDLEDQTQNENNILNMLRSQNNEEINTYEGDKKSYAHQIKSIYDDVKYVQDDMVFAGESNEDEVDQKIKEFTDAANRLNEFDSSVENDLDNEEDFEESDNEESVENDDENIEFNELDEESNEYEEIENEEFDKNSENENYESFDFASEDEENDKISFNDENEDENNDDFNFGLDYDEDDDDSYESENESNFDFLNSDEDDRNSDYSSEESQNSSFFSSADTFYNSPVYTQNNEYEETTQESPDLDDYSEAYSAYESNQYYNEKPYEPVSFEPFKTAKFNQDEYDSTFVNVKKEPDLDQEYFDDSNIEDSDIDSIISKNASSMNETISQTSFFEKRYSTENYKQKLSNLTVYSKASTDSKENTCKPEEPAEADDLETLKLNFEREGIKIKEYKKISSFEEPEKTYLLTNKINLIKSVILLLGYAFLLSGMYIALQNTFFGAICEDFQIKYFLFGIIPFAIIALYHLVIFIINPYKKIPARFASRIMIFIAVILTVQLLLITYCVNLQLGFYSFTQAGYNHLLWIIPSLLSFGPIFSHIIYTALFHSGNFNV